jgi:hypothetical protein
MAGPGGSVVAYSRKTGRVAWARTVDGDALGLTVLNRRIYFGGHFDWICKTAHIGAHGDCLDAGKVKRHHLAALSPRGRLLSWNPSADSTAGVYAMAHTARRIAAGGAFTMLNNHTIERDHFALFRVH